MSDPTPPQITVAPATLTVTGSVTIPPGQLHQHAEAIASAPLMAQIAQIQQHVGDVLAAFIAQLGVAEASSTVGLELSAGFGASFLPSDEPSDPS